MRLGSYHDISDDEDEKLLGKLSTAFPVLFFYLISFFYLIAHIPFNNRIRKLIPHIILI